MAALKSDADYQTALCWPKFICSKDFERHVLDCLEAAYEIGRRAAEAAARDDLPGAHP